MRLRILAVLTVVSASPLVAQGSAELRTQWQGVSGYLLRAAQQVPDSMYSFKPAPTVRSFGQLVAHVAGSQHMFCGAATGAKAGAEDDLEKKNLSKAELVKELEASNAHCAQVYAMNPAKMTGHVSMFGQTFTKPGLLLVNAMHDDEHYGNMVTYMRIMGMVPPSSQPATR